MSRNNFSDHSLMHPFTMEFSKTGRHDSIQHSPKNASRERSNKSASKRDVRATAKKSGAQGAEQLSAEDEGGAEEEDSSSKQDDDNDDVEEPDVFASSDDCASAEGTFKTSSRTNKNRTGRISGNEHAELSKKRSRRDRQTKSILNGRDAMGAYPRKKSQRRLSNNHGLFTYDADVAPLDKNSEFAITLSDDDDYDAVDLISESEDDENVVEKLEERAIVDSELEEIAAGGYKRQRSDADSDIMSMMDLAPEFGMKGDSSFFAEQMDQMHVEQTLFLLDYGSSPSPQPSPTTRKVRFADVVNDSRTSSENSSETAELPDIFMDTSMSMPGVNSTPRADKYDSFNSNSNSEDGSYWDWKEEEADLDTPTLRGPQALTVSFASMPIEVDNEGEEVGASSGYDTDSSGDTTEDDIPPPPRVTTPKATLRSYKPPTRRPAFRHAGRPSRSLPILGSFIVDRTKAVGYRHRTLGNIVFAPMDPNHELARFFPRSDASSTVQSSPQTPFQSFPMDDSDFSDASRNPFSGSLDVMFSGMFGGAFNQTYNLGGQIIGPPEAFYPFTSIDSSGSVFDVDEGSYDEDDSDCEDKMDIHDFIKFGMSDDDDDDDDDDAGMSYVETTAAEESEACSPTSPAPTDASSAMTPFRSNSIGGSELMLTPAPSQSMLEHLDRGFVTSFRKNQDRAKHLSRLPHNYAERASHSKPIRSHYAANSVITPMRKRKPSRDETTNMKMSGSKILKKKEFKIPRKPKLPARGFF